MFERKLKFSFHSPISGFVILRAIHASVRKVDDLRLVMLPRGTGYDFDLRDEGGIFPDIAIRPPDDAPMDTSKKYREFTVAISIDDSLSDQNSCPDMVGLHFSRFIWAFSREIRLFSHPCVGLCSPALQAY